MILNVNKTLDAKLEKEMQDDIRTAFIDSTLSPILYKKLEDLCEIHDKDIKLYYNHDMIEFKELRKSLIRFYKENNLDEDEFIIKIKKEVIKDTFK
ncbi:hypothetical protein [Staphylococcus phage S6]|nr:hypothetical protein [Staphylococcus phage S6]